VHPAIKEEIERLTLRKQSFESKVQSLQESSTINEIKEEIITAHEALKFLQETNEDLNIQVSYKL